MRPGGSRRTQRCVAAARAVFRDDRGHEVYFSARPGATTFSFLCD